MIDDDPKPNAPADLGWTRRAVTFPVPPSTPQKECRSCRAKIFWIVTAAGKRMPVNPDGTSHFANCKHAADWRKAR